MPAPKDAARATCGSGTRKETARASGRFFPLPDASYRERPTGR